MTAMRHSHQLAELVSARLTSRAHDDVATIVLGPRIRDLCTALDIPTRDWLQISRWADQCRVPGGDQEFDAFGSYVDVLVADRCRVPGDDLLSDLIAYEADGDGLTADEIRSLVVELVCF
jgi:cytochrome P450